MAVGKLHASARSWALSIARSFANPRAITAIFLAALVPACGRSLGTGTSTNASPPFAAIPSTPSGVQRGVILISYSLKDPAALTCTLTVAYSVDGGVTFQPASSGPGGDGTTDLVSSPGGTARVFAWNSLADGVALGAAIGVRMRFTPVDTAPGAPSLTATFMVDNSADAAPSVSIQTPSGTQGGLVAISYSLIDAESDP